MIKTNRLILRLMDEEDFDGMYKVFTDQNVLKAYELTSFTSEQMEKWINRKVISLDPVYQFSKEDLLIRINETKELVLEQARKNKDNFIWKHIKSVSELEFDLGLSSHFLVLYSQLGLDFHIQSIAEMLGICREIRIFPLVNLNAEESGVLTGIIDYFKNEYHVRIAEVNYEFQKNGNKMLQINREGFGEYAGC